MTLRRFERNFYLTSLCLYITLGFVYAQPSSPTIDVAYHVDYGQYLIDIQGRSLYALTSDANNQSSCYDACAQTWPPVLAQDENVSAAGVTQYLLGTTEREDGSLQLTFNGMPLYYFAQDQDIGDFNGEGVGDRWFLVSNQGELIRTIASPEQVEEAPVPTEADEEVASTIPADTLEEGAAIYTTTSSPSCSSCHGAEGGGGAGAALAESARLSDTALVLRQIIEGGHTMPAFGGQLSDRQVAAVATFIRNSWGNEHGAITPEEVGAAR